MRLVKVLAPIGKSESVAKLAFSCGINQVSVGRVTVLSSNQAPEEKETIDLETSTPKSKKFIDELLAADFYNSTDYSINTRQPRSILSKEQLKELTRPLVIPVSDITEELWQFSHVTTGFIGRNFIAACLLAYGLIQHQILLIIAGLLFLQLLPLLLGVSFGTLNRNWKLTGQSLAAFAAAVITMLLGGVLTALVSNPPVKYEEFNSMFVGFLISLAVGIAAGLATTDDVGRREFLGLAATAQIAIIPVWFGICLIFGFPISTGQNEIITRLLGFGLNILTIISASLITYFVIGVEGKSDIKIHQ